MCCARMEWHLLEGSELVEIERISWLEMKQNIFRIC